MIFVKTIIVASIIACVAAIDLLDNIEIDRSQLTDNRIIGGKLAKWGQFPYQILIIAGALPPNANLTARIIGSGSIISSRWIVTAASCLRGETEHPFDLLVLTGVTNLLTDGTLYLLDDVISHPEFQSSESEVVNDIALLRTRHEFEFSKIVRALPLKGHEIDGSVRSIVSGWGTTQAGNRTIELQYLNVYSLSNEDCREQLGERETLVNNGTVCARRGNGYGACFGDVGGPLTANGKLYGIVLNEYSCGRGAPDVYTRVSSFLEWIHVHTNVSAW